MTETDKKTTRTEKIVKVTVEAAKVTGNQGLMLLFWIALIAITGIAWMASGFAAVVVILVIAVGLFVGVRFFTRPHKDKTLHWSSEKGWHTRD